MTANKQDFDSDVSTPGTELIDSETQCEVSGRALNQDCEEAVDCSKASCSTNIETQMVILRTQGVIAQNELLAQETKKFEPCRFCSYHSLFEHDGEDPIYKKGIWVKKGRGVCTRNQTLEFQNNRGTWFLCDEEKLHECHFYEKRSRAG